MARLGVLARRGLASGGGEWYKRARATVRTLALSYGVSHDRAASVLALTSPRVTVRQNVVLAERYLRDGVVPDLPTVRASLARWEATGEIRGPKVAAFRRALLGDPDAVVLDVWLLRALGKDPRAKLTPRQYAREAQRVTKLARRLGVTPAECQAAIWVAVRAQYNRRAEPGEMRVS